MICCGLDLDFSETIAKKNAINPKQMSPRPHTAELHTAGFRETDPEGFWIDMGISGMIKKTT